MTGIGFLGPLRVDGARQALSPRERVVLSALAVSGGGLAPDRLAAAVWGDDPPKSWPKQVQICVMRLRRALGPAAIATTEAGYRLAVPDDDLDVHRFESLVQRGRVLAATDQPDRAASVLAEALGLWRGDPFPDLDDWPPARVEAARLSELRRCAQEDLLEARLAAGEHRVVAVEAEALTAAEPLREQRWALLALAHYRSGRQADALRSLHRARATLADQLGVDPGPDLVALESAILRQDPSLAAVAEAPPVADDCPYKGLAAYDESDGDRFHGREAEVAACLARLGSGRLVVVAGPSGCGKSSLVRAGLVPALRRQGRDVVVVVPGPEPEALRVGTDGGGEAGPVLVVDQFEDLFTLGASPAAIRSFCARVVEHAREPGQVVLAVRSDHLAHLAVDPALARLVERGMFLMGPPGEAALRSAIELPARQAGLRLEAGLVDLLVRDTEDEPGALPLLSHTLVETWRRRDGRVLTVEGYRATGGIRGAVARSADRLYESLPPDQRPLLRSLLLRLVAPVPDGEPVRSRVASRTLIGDPARERILQMLVRARLVTAGDETVELAHEALARAWPRLRTWLDDDAAGQRIMRHLAATAEGWQALGRPEHELYRGARLDAALEWRHATRPDLTPVEDAFLDASSAAATAERHAVAARARRQARQNRHLRALLAAACTLLVVALVAGAVAVQRTADARHQRDSARSAQLDAQLEGLANRSLALRATNRTVAALLAVETYRRRPDARAWSVLLGNIQAAPGFMGHHHLPADHYASGALLPGGSTAVVALDGHDLRLLDLDSGELHGRFPPLDRPATVPVTAVSGDGGTVALFHNVETTEPCYELAFVARTDGRGCASLSLHDVRRGRRIGLVVPPFSVGDVALDHGGEVVAVSGGHDGDVALYRAADGRLVGVVPGLPRPRGATTVEATAALAFAPDGRLVVGSMAGPVRLVDPASARVVAHLDAPPLSSNVAATVTPSGLLVAAGDQSLVAIDLPSGTTRWTAGGTGTAALACADIAAVEVTGRLYCGIPTGVVEEHDLGTGHRTGESYGAQLGGLAGMDVTDDGRDLVVFGLGAPVVSHWRLDGSGPTTRRVAEGHVVVDGYDPSGRHLLVARDQGGAPGDPADLADLAVWDPARDRAVEPVDVDPAAALWAGRDRLAILHRDGTSGYYDLDAGRPVAAGTAGDGDDGDDGGEPVSRAWLSAGDTRLFVSRVDGTGCEVRTHDPRDGSRVDPTIRIEGCYHLQSLSASPDGRRVAVTANVRPEVAAERITTVHDGAGRPVGEPLPGLSEVGLTDRLLVGADAAGDITVYDLDTLEVRGKLPAPGRVRSLEFGDGGAVLLAASFDGTVSLYDLATHSPIGEPIAGRPPDGTSIAGWLRPDGRALAVTEGNGVTVWDIAPDHLARVACRLAGRNLTRSEWDAYLSHLGDYRRTCPDLPPGSSSG